MSIKHMATMYVRRTDSRSGTAWKRMNCERLRSLEICLDVPTVWWLSRSSVKVAVTAQGSTPGGRSRSRDARPA